MQVVKYAFQQHGDERGMLVALEEYNDIPFEIKRVYYMYDTKEGVRRGFHAHKSLEQILICIHGSCKILMDNGKEKKLFLLKNLMRVYIYLMIFGGKCTIFRQMLYLWYWHQMYIGKRIILGIMMNL